MDKRVTEDLLVAEGHLTEALQALERARSRCRAPLRPEVGEVAGSVRKALRGSEELLRTPRVLAEADFSGTTVVPIVPALDYPQTVTPSDVEFVLDADGSRHLLAKLKSGGYILKYQTWLYYDIDLQRLLLSVPRESRTPLADRIYPLERLTDAEGCDSGQQVVPRPGHGGVPR